jgi:hypothetical protein
MAIRVVEFSSGEYKISKKFCLRINILKGKWLSFKNWVNGELSKNCHHFNNKVIQKLMLSKNVNNKKCALNWYSSVKKKLRKIVM